MKVIPRIKLLFFVLSASTFSVFGQSFDCQLVTLDFIKDTVNLEGNPAVVIQLSTVENTMGTGYTSFVLLNEAGDTVVDYSESFSYWMPAIEGIGDPVVTYILDFAPPFTTMGENFQGRLLSNFPVCEFPIALVSSTEEVSTASPIQFSPNPFSQHLNLQNPQAEDQVIAIYNALGILIYQGRLAAQETFPINTSDWKSGIYFLWNGKNHQQLRKL